MPLQIRTSTGQVLKVRNGINAETDEQEFVTTIDSLGAGRLSTTLRAATYEALVEKVQAFWKEKVEPQKERKAGADKAKLKLLELDKRRPAVMYHVFQCLADPAIAVETHRLIAIEKFARIAEVALSAKHGWPMPKYIRESGRGRPPMCAEEAAARALLLVRAAGYYDPKLAAKRGLARFGNTWSSSLPWDDYEAELKYEAEIAARAQKVKSVKK